MLKHPSGQTLAHFHPQAPQSLLLIAPGNGVIEFLAEFVEHEQRPQLRFHHPLHVFQDGVQNCVQIEARGERSRQLMKNKQISERDASFRLVWHVFGPGGQVFPSFFHTSECTQVMVRLLHVTCIPVQNLCEITALTADVHHRARRLQEFRFTDVMPCFFSLNNTHNVGAKFLVAGSCPQSPVKIVFHL